MNISEPGAIFDETYYRTGCGLPYSRNDHWLNFFGDIASHVVRSLAPRRIFDAGCAMGMLVESFWDRGVEACGVDISSYAISQVRPDMRPYCRVGSLVDPIADRYDLVTCIEVTEHMPETEAQAAIGNLARAADRILFSSTPSDFSEPTHINIHPPIYWLTLFAAQGFWPELLFDAGFVAPHAILFSRRERLSYSDRELLGTFSEILRLRCAMVDRERRIGQLQAEHDERLKLLTTDLHAAREARLGTEAELAGVRGQLAILTEDLARMQAAHEAFWRRRMRGYWLLRTNSLAREKRWRRQPKRKRSWCGRPPV